MAQFIQYFAAQYGTQQSPTGQRLNVKLSYYQIARSIGISYEECVRLFKSIPSVVSYSRGGTITLLDSDALEAIANGSDNQERDAKFAFFVKGEGTKTRKN